MNIIEFRAWHPVSKQMFAWDTFSINGRNNCIIHITEGVFTTSKVDDNSVELLQFTGQTDKNGKGVYAGDILLSANGKDKYVVIWDKAGWFREAISHHQSRTSLFPHAKRQEVIGNIYEHPQLAGLG